MDHSGREEEKKLMTLKMEEVHELGEREEVENLEDGRKLRPKETERKLMTLERESKLRTLEIERKVRTLETERKLRTLYIYICIGYTKNDPSVDVTCPSWWDIKQNRPW